MKIRANKIMEQALRQRGHDFIKATVALPTAFEKIPDQYFSRLSHIWFKRKHWYKRKVLGVQSKI